jgi:hypothetical protein
MTDIALSLIDPNPFRNFELHPIDQVQVERLKASIGSDGFWASVTARKVGDRYQLAFGHHRIEAARDVPKIDSVPLEVRELSDWQMVRMLASENATQRGTTAAASLDAIAAISKEVSRQCIAGDAALIAKNFAVSLTAAERMWGNIRAGGTPGEDCIVAVAPTGAFTLGQIRTALGVLRDSRSEPSIFDANCARLFRLDYHLQEFRRIVTGDVVRSYLPVEKQFSFAQQIIAALGTSELTAIKLRERANIIFYEELGMPRHDMRNSSLRLSDDRVKDALNLMRRGTHSVKQCCRMLADLMAEGTDVAPEVIDRFKDYITEIDVALKSLTPDRSGKRSSNLRLIVNNREDVA